MKIGKMQKEVYLIACNHGFHAEGPPKSAYFYETDMVARWLMLMVTELAEAMEAVRHKDWENFKEELADVAIRLFDTCESMNIDLEDEMLRKCAVNKDREFMHGNKSC
jgi:NTP pyrophosphatase (non-canonical NTP hydrolase)